MVAVHMRIDNEIDRPARKLFSLRNELVAALPKGIVNHHDIFITDEQTDAPHRVQHIDAVRELRVFDRFRRILRQCGRRKEQQG